MVTTPVSPAERFDVLSGFIDSVDASPGITHKLNAELCETSRISAFELVRSFAPFGPSHWTGCFDFARDAKEILNASAELMTDHYRQNVLERRDDLSTVAANWSYDNDSGENAAIPYLRLLLHWARREFERESEAFSDLQYGTQELLYLLSSIVTELDSLSDESAISSQVSIVIRELLWDKQLQKTNDKIQLKYSGLARLRVADRFLCDSTLLDIASWDEELVHCMLSTSFFEPPIRLRQVDVDDTGLNMLPPQLGKRHIGQEGPSMNHSLRIDGRQHLTIESLRAALEMQFPGFAVAYRILRSNDSATGRYSADVVDVDRSPRRLRERLGTLDERIEAGIHIADCFDTSELDQAVFSMVFER